jgi:spermidine/putrescine transport system substrate-binding protein
MEDQGITPNQGRQGGMTRGEFLRLGAGVGAGIALGGSLLAACGSSSSAGSAASASPTSAAGTLDFYSWQTYDLPYPAMKTWLKANGITMNARYVSNGDDITTMFTTGGGKGLYNLSTYGAPYASLYKKLNMIQPLDLTRIPNYNSDFFSFFRSGPVWSKYWNIGGQQMGIPFSWGWSATNYDSSKVPPPKKATDLLSAPYKGKFGMTDDMQGLITQAAMIAGLADVNTNPNMHFTKAQLNQIMGILKEFKAASYRADMQFGDVANLYNSGAIVASLTTFPGFNTMVSGMEKQVKSVIVEEGALGYCDSYFMPQGSKDQNSVYAWLNEICTPHMQVTIAEDAVAGITNSKTPPLLTPEFRTMFPYDNLNTFFTKCPLFGIPTDVQQGGQFMSYEDWTQAWEAFKNA